MKDGFLFETQPRDLNSRRHPLKVKCCSWVIQSGESTFVQQTDWEGKRFRL